MSKKKTILVVDDEELIRSLFEDLLEEYFHVITAKDGLDAVRAYEENVSRIELAILDIIMPGMRGDKVFAFIRERNPALPVLFVTGNAMDVDMIELGKHEYVEILPKPFSQSQIETCIARLLGTPIAA
ncbi:MAG: response regulator [Rhizobacter sp.]|nr:response regulator [Chlorobiales bacterium]